MCCFASMLFEVSFFFLNFKNKRNSSRKMNNHIRCWFILLKCSSFLHRNGLSIFKIRDTTNPTTSIYQAGHSHPSLALPFNILFAFTGFFCSELGQRLEKWKSNPERNLDVFSKAHLLNYFLYNRVLF